MISHTGTPRRGPIPSWFIDFKNPGDLKGSHGPIPNQHALFWFIHHNRTIVKIHKRSKSVNNNEILKGKHYTIGSNNLLSKCPGCPIGNSIQANCIILFSSTDASSLWTVLTNSQHSKYKLCNSLNELPMNPSTTERPLTHINISNFSQNYELLQKLGPVHQFSLQIIKQETIINNLKIRLANPGSSIGNALQIILNIAT